MLPMLAITAISGEADSLRKLEWGAGGIAALVASCLGGLGMSYFSFALRAVISATSFSVIGNVCKVLTILVNLLMWDNHASAPPAPLCAFPPSLPPADGGGFNTCQCCGAPGLLWQCSSAPPCRGTPATGGSGKLRMSCQVYTPAVMHMLKSDTAAGSVPGQK